MRQLAILVATLLASGTIARAATPLPLGTGTACVLVPERDAKTLLGVKKRHVLACADPSGKVVRVLITRRGTVDCVDGVQVGPNGKGSDVQKACAGIRPASTGAVPAVVNLSGSWQTTLPGIGLCDIQVTQDGDALTLSVGCPGTTLNGSGTIDFNGFSFDSHGTTYISGLGACDGRLVGTVTPDGQHTTGTASCGAFGVGFTADRR